MEDRQKTVLLLAPDKRNGGGVVFFVELLRRNFSNRISSVQFTVGSRAAVQMPVMRLLTTLFDAVRLMKLIVGTHFDVVHVNPSLNYKSIIRDSIFLVVLNLCRFDNIVITIHGWDDSFAHRLKKYRIAKFIFRKLFGRAKRLVVLAPQFREYLVNIGINRAKVDVMTTMFDPEIFQDVRRNKINSGIDILFMSRLVKEKGIYELLEAFQRVQLKIANVRLIIAGDGPEKDRLSERVREMSLDKYVIMLGHIGGKDKAQTLVNSDIFVFPTYYGEGCPIALLEAMAAGLPVISTNAGGIGEVFVNGKNGIVVNSVTAESVEIAIIELLSDEELRDKMAKYNKVEAWERYEASVISRKIESIYEDAVFNNLYNRIGGKAY